MLFFFPDSQDQVDPYFDLISEEHPPHRVRQRDDQYAHEILREIPYDGILISKAIVDGSARGSGKYTMAQRQRLYRLGAHKFFRAELPDRRLLIMGDCGAFNYADEEVPPYTADEVIDFYDGLALDRGVAPDHIIFSYLNRQKRSKGADVDPDWKRRREVTIDLAGEFIERVDKRGCSFEPIGSAQGWDPASYKLSVVELQAMGYRKISIGGLVPLKTPDLLEVVKAVSSVRAPDVQFHLLGVTRTDHLADFATYGVTSFDSTSPFRQSFKDDTDNYYLTDGALTALRVPQVDGNMALKKRIRAGQLDQRVALNAERQCLDTLRRFDAGDGTMADASRVLREYELLHDGRKDRVSAYTETLSSGAWKECRCGICDRVGIEVALFRGSERNKRRGFHNLAVFRQRLDAQLAAVDFPDLSHHSERVTA